MEFIYIYSNLKEKHIQKYTNLNIYIYINNTYIYINKYILKNIYKFKDNGIHDIHEIHNQGIYWS